MNLLNKIRATYYRWRLRLENRRFRKGWKDAHIVYQRGAFSLDEIELITRPVGNETPSAYSRGAIAAVNLLREQQEPTNTTGEIDTNANGDPVGVPYFIDQTSTN